MGCHLAREELAAWGATWHACCLTIHLWNPSQAPFEAEPALHLLSLVALNAPDALPHAAHSGSLACPCRCCPCIRGNR
jgi:hypothetical protein